MFEAYLQVVVELPTNFTEGNSFRNMSENKKIKLEELLNKYSDEKLCPIKSKEQIEVEEQKAKEISQKEVK